MIVAIGVGLYEQSKAEPNKFIMIAAIVIFMYGMMRLSAKVPSKHAETDEESEKENEKND